MKKVLVGLSGGVDSSVAAFLLKQQGYDVIGAFMKNWEEEGPCPSASDYEDALRVSKQIGIPCYSFNFAKEYKEKVFSHFLEEYKKGYTPNPDILCNKEIKFEVFLKKAKELGADFLATGHYCQKDNLNLIRGLDSNKDQSYFLYTLKSDILQNVLFPIGHLSKPEVRKIAEENNLCTAEKKDSTGICFIGKRSFTPFLNQFIDYTPGNFENLSGQIIGTHQGISFYTIGQRKGLQIGGKGDAWFVVGKDIEKNVIFVEQGTEHPALYSYTLTATDITWVNKPPSFPYRCTAKVRYRQKDDPCTIHCIENNEMLVSFDNPQRAITPRQSVVFYDKNICLGGALIKKPGPSLYKKP